jgi:hypothetical protein
VVISVGEKLRLQGVNRLNPTRGRMRNRPSNLDRIFDPFFIGSPNACCNSMRFSAATSRLRKAATSRACDGKTSWLLYAELRAAAPSMPSTKAERAGGETSAATAASGEQSVADETHCRHRERNESVGDIRFHGLCWKIIKQRWRHLNGKLLEHAHRLGHVPVAEMH